MQKSKFKSELLKRTQREVEKNKALAKKGRSSIAIYSELIKDNILKLLESEYSSVGVLSKDLNVSKTFIYGVLKNKRSKKEKEVRNNNKENKGNHENIFDFLDITSSLKASIPPKQSLDIKKVGDHNATAAIKREDESEKSEKSEKKSHLKPFMKVSLESGCTIEIWG